MSLNIYHNFVFNLFNEKIYNRNWVIWLNIYLTTIAYSTKLLYIEKTVAPSNRQVNNFPFEYVKPFFQSMCTNRSKLYLYLSLSRRIYKTSEARRQAKLTLQRLKRERGDNDYDDHDMLCLN